VRRHYARARSAACGELTRRGFGSQLGPALLTVGHVRQHRGRHSRPRLRHVVATHRPGARADLAPESPRSPAPPVWVCLVAVGGFENPSGASGDRRFLTAAAAAG